MTTKTTNPLRLLPLCAALVFAGAVTAAHAQATAQDQLLLKLEQMSSELERLKAEVNQLKAAQGRTDATAQQAAMQASQAATQASQATAEARTATAAAGGSGLRVPGGPSTIIGGYGEINYNRYTRNLTATQADLRRVVIGLQHRFDEKTKFVGEFEWEHAV
ncbi:MAG: hypothetical protein H7332_10830, partial [Bdellovibrionales bacterium]|nr:hypothetical protein [Ramlibacter sp.]